jgi:hypothetical protein
MSLERPHNGARLLVATFCCAFLLQQTNRAGAEERREPESERPPETNFLDLPAILTDFRSAGARLIGRGNKATAAEAEPREAEPKGTSSNSAKKAAIDALPLDQLSPQQRPKVDAVLKNISFYRQLPTVVFAVDPDVYSYFVAHPDVAVSIWRAMKISKLQMWQTGKTDYEADTGDGTLGTLEVLCTAADRQLVYCEGLYRSPLVSKPIEAKSLLMLQSNFQQDAEGIVYVTHRAELFVTFPSQTIDVVAKIFSPLTVAMTDRTFSEVSLFLKMMSLAMSRRPDWVEDITRKMDGVPEIRKQQVLMLAGQAYSAAQKRTLDRLKESGDFPGSTAGSESPTPARVSPPRVVSEERGTSPVK